MSHIRNWNKDEKMGDTITEVINMRKNNKQKKSMIFSTVVVLAGCMATALYVNQSMNTATNYKLDLSQIGTDEEVGDGTLSQNPELGSGASLARVSGHDVINEYPKDTAVEDTNKETQKVTEKEIKQEEKQEETEDTAESEESLETSSDSIIPVVNNLTFSEEDGMTWPLAGNVILNYSMDSAVYFETLMQYKYNPAILIGAVKGDSVSAVSQGQVVKIAESAELGQYVVMNVGSGYEVTYGQLESLKVQEGSVVSRGQTIGNVAKTSKYYSVEGDHVYLMITKDGEPVDPLSLLQ